MRETTIRPGRPEDAWAVAPLIHLAGPRFHDYVFSPSRQSKDAIAFIEQCWRAGGNPQSWEHGQVAEHDGRVVGVAVVYDTGQTAVLLRGMALRIAFGFAPWQWPGIVRRALGLDRLVTGVPEDGSLYLAALGVEPAHQGRGIGRMLVEPVIAEARRKGKDLYLHVALHNDRARHLYENLGFRVLRVCRDAHLEQEQGLDGQLLMRLSGG